MYDLDKKIIFTHPKKCGGTSVEKLLGFLDLRLQFPSVKPFKHASLSEHINKLTDKNINTDDFLKFSIIRNPWDRAVSFYNHYKYRQYDFVIQQQKEEANIPMPEAAEDARRLSFKDFIFKHFAHNFNSNVSTIPYMFFDGKYYMDYVIRLESIKKDLHDLQRKLQIDLRSGVPHHNNNDEFISRIPYQDYYDFETKNLIKRAFDWDIKTFNYIF
jgi:hypothetical protein